MTGEGRDEYEGVRVPPPPRLYVDALGYVWQDGHAPGFLSMARTTDRNIPSPGLITYLPERRQDDDRWLAEHDREVAAKALEDAADHYTNRVGGSRARPWARIWLRERAQQIRGAS